jgi:hypothetical protein
MKNKKTFLWIALIVMAIIPVYAQQYDSEKDFEIDWDKNVKDGVIITKYIGTKKEVRIPPSIQNYPVTGIGGNTFSGNKNITKVTIPDSVISIGKEAFFGTGLNSIIIPNSVTSIGETAFGSCSSLNSITIGSGVTSIGSGAFSNCISLKSVTIPNGVTWIDWATFSYCTSLTSVTIPNSVISIEGMIIGGNNFYGPFAGCTSLSSVTIPDSVVNIGDGAFAGSGITSITIPDSVIIIGKSAFRNCNKLTSATIIGNSNISIMELAFYECTSLANVTIGNGITNIEGGNFLRCNNLTSVTFKGTITFNGLGERFSGDLRDKYLASDGGPGTYKRFAGGDVWKKQ